MLSSPSSSPRAAKRQIVVEFAIDAVEGAEGGFELLALAHQALGAKRIVPEAGRLRLAVELAQPRLCLFGVKDTSGAKTGIL